MWEGKARILAKRSNDLEGIIEAMDRACCARECRRSSGDPMSDGHISQYRGCRAPGGSSDFNRRES